MYLVVVVFVFIYLCADPKQYKVPLFALANPFRHRYAPLSDLEQGFGSDMRAGLSSRTFDLSQNLNGDSRAGLDTAAKEEIHKMMEQRGISFDEARKVFFHKKLLENGIGKFHYVYYYSYSCCIWC